MEDEEAPGLAALTAGLAALQSGADFDEVERALAAEAEAAEAAEAAAEAMIAERLGVAC